MAAFSPPVWPANTTSGLVAVLLIWYFFPGALRVFSHLFWKLTPVFLHVA